MVLYQPIYVQYDPFFRTYHMHQFFVQLIVVQKRNKLKKTYAVDLMTSVLEETKIDMNLRKS